MKSLLTLSLILFSQLTFAYDPKLMINVKKASALLERAENHGVQPDGSACYVEVRRIEDGYYTLYTSSENEELFIGLDIEAYGKIVSSWTKRTFTIHQRGFDGGQELKMKEEYSTKKLSVYSSVTENGKTIESKCYLPLKHF